MNIFNIGTSALGIYIPPEELYSKGLEPNSLTVDDTAALVKVSVPEMEDYFSQLEVFSGNDDVLVFMFFSSREPVFFLFDNIEDVIAVSKLCRREPADLYYTGEAYILAVYPWRGEEVPAALFEFGTRLNAPREYAMHLREHAEIVMETDALYRMEKTF